MMNSMPRRFLAHATLALSAALTLVLGGFAPAAQAQDPDVDPPGRVARLSASDGQVWVYSPDAAEWVTAVRNQPLTSGDRVATDNGARAELQIGSTSVRLDSATELEVVQLDDEHAELALVEGSAIAQLRDLNGAGQVEVSTDEGRFVTLRAGSYRFDRADGKSDVTVYTGQARYEGPSSALPVNAGQHAEFWIDSGGVAQYSMLAPASDDFTAWSNERDRRVSGSVAERYVSPEMTGAAELDAYGRWEQDPDYGSVWIPTAVAVDWAPYSHGRWTWVRPWGWTWIDDAPWGFAPFHYGRWVYARNNWCWTPGTRVARPIYAPALVAWVGGPRGSVSVTVGGGLAVGWFPLAPREVYVPSYRVSPRYARSVNITNVTNVTVINNAFSNPQAPREFQNRRAPRAITVVPSGVMTERRPVAPAAAQFRQTPWVRELAAQPGRTAAMLAPPVSAPAAPARAPDARNVRPPPGGADRSGAGGVRPGAPPPRDRSEADRDRRAQPPREVQRPEQVPAARPQAPAVRPQTPGAQPAAPTAPAALPERAPIATPPRPGAEPADPRRPGVDNPGQRPEQRPGQPSRGEGRRDDVQRPPRSAAPQPVAPAPAVPAAPAAQSVRPAAAPAPEAPTMRPLPMRRGDDQHPEERRAPPPRSEPAEQRPSPQQQQQQQRVERPAPPVVQRPVAPAPAPPVEVQRPAPPPQQQRVERPAPPVVQRPAAPAPPVEVPRPAPAAVAPAPPPQRAEPRRPEGPRGDEKRGDEPKRGDQQR